MEGLIRQYSWIYAVGGSMGWICGETCIILFYYLYCEPRGIYYTLWHPSYLIFSGVMVAILFLISSLKVNKRLKSVDLIVILYE